MQFKERNIELAKASIRGAGKASLRGARFLRFNARSLAPKATGNLVNSILIRKTKRGHNVMVTALGNDGFPYPKWVNQSAGFTQLQYPKGGPKDLGIRPGMVAIYGSLPLHWNWSGQPRFFRTATLRLRKQFKKLAVQTINNEMKVSIT